MSKGGDHHHQKRTIRKRQQTPIKEDDQEEAPITNRKGWLEEDRNHPRKGLYRGSNDQQHKMMIKRR